MGLYSRSLVLLAPELSRDYPELASIEDRAVARPVPQLGAVGFAVGPGSRWADAAAVVGYVRELVGVDRLSALRAAWLPADAALDDAQQVQMHLAALIHAQPVRDLVPEPRATPLGDLLTRGGLETWYQPIFCAGTFDVWGYECLVRGRSAEGDTLNPGLLLQWAAQEGMLHTFDAAARETHLANAGRAKIPPHAHILINFMPGAIEQTEQNLDALVDTTHRSGLDPRRIIFEVVESEAVEDREKLATILGHYRRRGFRVALDDVGNGHAGLIMLADLDPDLIKIDRYLIQRAPASAAHRRICASLIELGHDQRKLVLAEGVETPEEKRLMDQLGVDLFQGYLFARPNPTPVTRPTNPFQITWDAARFNQQGVRTAVRGVASS